jgi:hypothetical protein
MIPPIEDGMSFRIRTCAVSVLLCGLAATSAIAQTPAEVAANWGLLGVWSLDCGQPTSRANARLSFVQDGGRLIHRRNFGDRSDEHAVVAARLLDGDRIEVVIDLQQFSQRREIVFAKEGEGKKRTVSNRDDKNVYSIRDGKFVASGQPAPVQIRCATLTN